MLQLSSIYALASTLETTTFFQTLTLKYIYIDEKIENIFDGSGQEVHLLGFFLFL